MESEIPEAFAEMGHIYRLGQFGVVQSDKKAAKLYKRGVELGNVDSMLSLGSFYMDGRAVKYDIKKGMKLLRMAADKGHALAQSNVATGLIRQEKWEESIHYLKLAASQGFLDAQCNLGVSYARGDGIEVDLEEARRWWNRAAEKGHPTAIECLRQLNSQLNRNA